MLYVFIVSSGMMMKFDMNLAVKKVLELKKEIARRTKLKVEEQVLLCSGGEELQSDNIVGNYYGAGTDTNPIFLFKKYDEKELSEFLEKEKKSKPSVPPHLRELLDKNIDESIIESASMTPNKNAVYVQLSLSQRLAEAAINARRECEELVHSQHLQQQGWAAVIANLEDARDTLVKRKDHFEEVFQKYLSNRASYLETIHMFPESIDLLSKIPLLSKLIFENDCADEDLNAKHTLLSWFISEPQDILESLVEKCYRLLNELNECTIVELNDNLERVLRNVDNNEMKVVKGIEVRLTSLNAKIENARKLEKDQRDLAAWFNRSQDTIANDPHSIPDIFKTFQSQLQIMLENHGSLRTILEQCNLAKNQLSDHIDHRLQLISKVESEMYRLHMQIHLLENHVQSVMSQVESYHQVQLAPERYLKLLAEVCRRKVFSANFMKWAKELSSQASKVYHKEVNLRKSFSSTETKNMVDNLFPGMNDVPPPFAVDCPQPFDQHLPDIVKEDLEWLKINFPALSHFCEIVPPDAMPCVSQAESDSAFSSNIPSSRVASDSAVLSEKVSLKEELHSDKLTVPSGDFYSLPSEYASLPNEVFSLTSSPFEDPLLPSHMQDQRTKTLQFSDKCGSREQIGATYSDSEEFETVENYRTSPVVTTSQPAAKLKARPTSSSDVIDVNINQKLCSKVSKARSDGDALSPMQERLKSPDSLAISSDFQAAEYYIDDSMPSSYTESNATSPLMRGSRMVKSHHVVVAELQRQVEEKSGALIVTKNSLENTHSNVLKLHAKLSALQKFIQELKGNLRSDLSDFKAFVTEELSGKMTEVTDIVNYINSYIEKMEQQMNLEKDAAINEAKSTFLATENALLEKLEIERQKLNDAEKQIFNYEERLQDLYMSCEEIKHDKDFLEKELQEKKELIQRMMLEHELEFDSFKNSMKLKVEGQEEEIDKLKQELSDAHSEITKLRAENNDLLNESEKHYSIVSSIQDEQNSLKDELNRLQEENRSVKDIQKLERELELAVKEKNQYLKELEKANACFDKFKEDVESLRAIELKELEEKLALKHRSDIESLRSRFKLAISMTSTEKSPSSSLPETQDTESLEWFEELKQIVADNQEKLAKLKTLEEQVKEINVLKDSAEEALVKHEEEKLEIIKALRFKHEGALEKLKSRITAENQVSFNEAINSLAKEKDSVIENLRLQNSVLDAKLFAIKSYLDHYQHSLASVGGVVSGMTRSESGATSSMAAIFNTDEYKCFFKIKADLGAIMQVKDTVKSSYQLTRSSTDSNESLRKKLKIKEEEYSCLLSKFMSSSVRQFCSLCSNKISILTCEPGDLVLVYYEEKLEHFMIYQLGTHLHFLHLDSVAAMELQIPSAESPKWFLGKVTHKEFCVTKKQNNRFKLKVGTRFYRVKIDEWHQGISAIRSAALSLEQSILIHATDQPALSQSVSVDSGLPPATEPLSSETQNVEALPVVEERQSSNSMSTTSI